MKLHTPFEIAPNLEPGLRIGDAWITLQYSNRPHPEGRQRYCWTWFRGAREESGDDLASGCGGGTLIQGFNSLLSFLSAFAEAKDPDDENYDLFPQAMREWAELYSEEIGMLELEIDDAMKAGDDLIDEDDGPDEDMKTRVCRLLVGMDDKRMFEDGLAHIAHLARRAIE
jgi:hypothetical protein